MDPIESSEQKLARVVREIGTALRKEANGRWGGAVRTARRDLGDRHVWRFRAGDGEPDRFLLLSHQAMTQGTNPAHALLAQLGSARWLERMQRGPGTTFRLTPSGRLRARSAE